MTIQNLTAEEVLNDENTYRKHLTQSVYATANIASTKFLVKSSILEYALKSQYGHFISQKGMCIYILSKCVCLFRIFTFF